jgi:cardiolipin synthase
VELRWFHRWQWSRPLRYNQRNHRKLLVVDAEQAFLGGFNIHRESSRAHFGTKRWRDTHVAVTGPLAEQTRAAFQVLWRNHDWDPDAAQGISSALIIPNRSLHCRHQLRCILSMMFSSARENIDITTPYFVPDEWTQRALVGAARRGVAVRLLVPSRSDIAPIRWIAQRVYSRIQHRGIRVFGYLPRLLHAKTITVDGDWASIGTANLDYRSLFVNHELNLCARSPTLAMSLQAQFEADLENSEELAVANWPHGPVAWRLMAPAAWAARRWL